ncbi:hypothetical protein ATCC90586_007707 [Pythium insidiosum]|nr:hypothetical protein ATCC90586_007707 [Pythium insidiosum]
MQVLSATHEYFAAVSEDNRLKVWDVSSGAIEHDLKERDHLKYKYTCIAWTQTSPLLKAGSKRAKASGQGLIALGTSTGAIVIWDLQRGEVVQRLASEKEGHGAAIHDVAFNSQGSLLYSCSNDKHVLEWNVQDGSIARRFRCGSEGAQKVSVSPQDEILAIGGTTIRTYDLSSGKKARKLVAGLSSAVNQLVFSSCKRYLFSSTVGGRFVNMYDLGNADQDEPVLNFAMPSSSASLLAHTKSGKKKTDVLLAAVSTTGSLFVWSVRHKPTAAPRAQPLTPDAKSVVGDKDHSAGVLLAALAGESDSQPTQLLVVRGSTAKPMFETTALLDDQQQLRAELEFAAISEHLLLGDKTSAQKKQKVLADAAEQEKTHVPTLANRSGLAAAKAVVDATAAGDDEDEDDADEPTLAERVEALRERVESELAAEMARVDAEAAGDATGPARSERPDASSLSTLLEQALQSKDNAMLEYCLRTRDAKVIANTIKRVSSVKVLELLDILVLKFEKSPGRCGRLCPWIRAILLHHTAYLMTQPDLVQSLSALYQVLENRLKVHDALQRLAGRLSLVIGQIHEASAVQAEADDADAPRAKTVYREEEETDRADEEEGDDEEEEEEDEEEDEEDVAADNGDAVDEDDDEDLDMASDDDEE